MTPISTKRQEQIAQRRAQMPRSQRSTYDKAVSGSSLRAAVNAFCSECCGYQIEPVRGCTDLGCPLWAVRPYQDVSQNGREGHSGNAESPRWRKGGC